MRGDTRKLLFFLLYIYLTYGDDIFVSKFLLCNVFRVQIRFLPFWLNENTKTSLK